MVNPMNRDPSPLFNNTMTTLLSMGSKPMRNLGGLENVLSKFLQEIQSKTGDLGTNRLL
jgi:hypothetical protein